MKVIFTGAVPGVASRGDVKNVRDGFFRNFLMPRQLAVHATEPLLKEWDERRKKVLIKKHELASQLNEIKRRLEGATAVRIEKKVTKKGTLYGSIKAQDVVSAVQKQLSLEIPVEAVSLTEPIKTAGCFDIRINFGEGVETTLPVEVVANE